MRDHGRPRSNDNVLHGRGVCPSGRGLGGGDGDHSRHRSLSRGRARGRYRAPGPRWRVRQGPAGRLPFSRSPADRRQPTGAEDTGRLGRSTSARGALRHAGRDGALRVDRRDLRRSDRGHHRRDAALHAGDADLRTLGDTTCQAPKRGQGRPPRPPVLAAPAPTTGRRTTNDYPSPRTAEALLQRLRRRRSFSSCVRSSGGSPSCGFGPTRSLL